MKQSIKLFLASMLIFTFTTCDKDITHLTRRQVLYLSFTDQNGNDLLPRRDLLLDTGGTRIPPYYLTKDQYSLRLVVDGKINMNPDPISYYSYKGDGPNRLSFSCDEYNIQLKEKRDYLYCYYFSCPKLFGDNRERLIEIKLKYISKEIYTMEEIRFEKKVINQGKNSLFSTAVLSN